MRIRQIAINGSCVSIYNVLKDLKTRGSLSLRKLVSPNFVQLWYKISAGDFDYMLWSSLTPGEQDYLAKCVEMTHTICPEFQVALAKATKGTMDRLQLIEGEISAGNLNPALIEEFGTILGRLGETRQIPPMQVARLKKRLQRTYEEQLRTVASSKLRGPFGSDSDA